MGLFSKVIGVLSGGLGKKIVDTVRDYFPPSMSDKEKADFELKLLEVTRVQELQLLEAAQAADAEFNQRLKDMEGTASDLSKIPYLGAFIIFLRGTQRPAFGIFTLVMDYLVFSGAWNIPDGSRLESAFFAINLLVLGFLFGERAVKNILPLFDRYLNKK